MTHTNEPDALGYTVEHTGGVLLYDRQGGRVVRSAYFQPGDDAEQFLTELADLKHLGFRAALVQLFDTYEDIMVEETGTPSSVLEGLLDDPE